MKTFTIVITGTFSAETPEEEVTVNGQIIAAGRLGINALPGKVISTGAVTIGAPQRDGYHQKAEQFTYPLEATQPTQPAVAPAPADAGADVTDPAPAM